MIMTKNSIRRTIAWALAIFLTQGAPWAAPQSQFIGPDVGGLSGAALESAGTDQASSGWSGATWTDVAYDAGNFTANGSMTWTVAEADQIVYRYMVIGDVMVLNVTLITTTVAGTPSTQLKVAIPGGYSGVVTSHTAGPGVDNGTNEVFTVSCASTDCDIYRAAGGNWSASTDLTYVQFMAIFEVEVP